VRVLFRDTREERGLRVEGRWGDVGGDLKNWDEPSAIV
jgi:hypothetical protein